MRRVSKRSEIHMSQATEDDSFGIPALDDWYDAALKHGMGFQSEAERQAYVASLGDPLEHPMFATSDEDLLKNPLTDAFRLLREEDKTPLQLCTMYKDEGNEWIKKGDAKSLREGINIYMHGLSLLLNAQEGRQQQQQQEEDEQDTRTIMSQVHGNIALAHLQLKNFGSCLKAADMSLRYGPSNIKAHFRRAKSQACLHRYDKAIEACREALAMALDTKQSVGVEPLQALLESCQAQLARRDKERKERAGAFAAQELAWRTCWQLCQQHGARLSYFNPAIPLPAQLNGKSMPFLGDALEEEEGQEQAAAAAAAAAAVGGGGVGGGQRQQDACWPCVLTYPEYGQFDAIEQVRGGDFLVEHVAVIFPDLRSAAPVAWDARRDYQYDKLVAYVFVHSSVDVYCVGDCNAWLQYCRDTWTLTHGAPPPELAEQTPSTDDEALELANKKHVGAAKRRVEDILAQLTASSQVSAGRHVEVGLGCTFTQVLALPGHLLMGGLLQLKIYVRGSEAHAKFLQRERTVFHSLDMECVGLSLAEVQKRMA